MSLRTPVAFLSYVRDDDAHDFGGVTTLRERLEGEVKIQTGKRFEIFQDRNDIRWGQSWKERIEGTLGEATFLIPNITPSFFASPACRDELETFLRIERTLGVTKLILPVYYVTSDQIEGNTGDPLAVELKARNWTDWREFRFKPFESLEIRSALADLAKNIKGWTADLALIEEAATAPARSALTPDLSLTLPATVAAGMPRNPPWTLGGELNRRPPDDETYWVYTREFDEVIHAKELIGTPEQSAELLTILAARVARAKRANSKILGKLRAHIANGDGVAVTLLCDNSGSMRGESVTSTAVWACLASEIMDSFGVQHEILGFTTRSWKGGKSREEWLSNGKPKIPGRLCEIRHIVYKAFADSANDVMANCAVMLREGILKENIDGEALLWASERLLEVRAEKRLMFVISDGAPVDDSTLSVNSPSFLVNHLQEVVRSIEAGNDIDLSAIGIEFGARYYAKAEQVTASGVGLPIIQEVVRTLVDRTMPSVR